MIEVSTTAASVLALPGAVMPAVPTAVGGENTQIVEFSTVLTGATLATEAPAGPVARDVPVAPAVPQLLDGGKSGIDGKPTGKVLPAGKLPPPQFAASDEPARKSADEQFAEGGETAPAADLTATISLAEPKAPKDLPSQPTLQAMTSQEQRNAPLVPPQATAPAAAAKRVPASKPTPGVHPAVLRTQTAASAQAHGAAQAIAGVTTPVQITPAPLTLPHASIVPTPASLASVQSPLTPAPAAAPLGEASPVASAIAQVAAAPGAPRSFTTATASQGLVLPDAIAAMPQASQPTPSVQPIAPLAAEQVAFAGVSAIAMTNVPSVPAPSTAADPAPYTAAPADGAPIEREPRATPAEPLMARIASDLVAARAPSAPLALSQIIERETTFVNAPDAIDAPAQLNRTDMLEPVSPDLRISPAAMPSLAPVPAGSTQDLAALVDRITEARAAAAPQIVRAALVHEDFGSISLNLRAEDSHIHVTLGSADPTFAPAVHAAAAASLASGAGDQSSESARRDAQNQQHTHQQDTAANNSQASQQQASNQQARDRAPAGERSQVREQSFGRQPAPGDEHAPSTPASPRRSGIYA